MAHTEGKGYVFAVCESEGDPYIQGALHVERDDYAVPWRYETDEEAARGAERDGVKLLYGIPYVEDGIYLDTPENRQLLGLYSRRMQRTLLNKKIPRKAMTDSCLPILLDIVKKVRYDVGCQTMRRCHENESKVFL